MTSPAERGRLIASAHLLAGRFAWDPALRSKFDVLVQRVMYGDDEVDVENLRGVLDCLRRDISLVSA